MSPTEARTRQELIDVKLHDAGWNVDDHTQVVEEYDISVGLPEGVREARTKYEGHQFSDYVCSGMITLIERINCLQKVSQILIQKKSLCLRKTSFRI